MQVSPIHNSNQNFGMSLKINPNVKNELSKQSVEYLRSVKKVGEDVKEVKLFDVILDGSLTPQVKKVGDPESIDYFAELKEKEPHLGKYCSIIVDDSEYGFFNPTSPNIFRDLYKTKADQRYQEFKKLDALHQAAELSKMLETQELAKKAKKGQDDLAKIKQMQEQQELENKKASMIGELLRKFKTIF